MFMCHGFKNLLLFLTPRPFETRFLPERLIFISLQESKSELTSLRIKSTQASLLELLCFARLKCVLFEIIMMVQRRSTKTRLMVNT